MKCYGRGDGRTQQIDGWRGHMVTVLILIRLVLMRETVAMVML